MLSGTTKQLLVRTFLLLCTVLGGCATLRVDVYVYKGPMVDTLVGRLAKAEGLARSVRDIAGGTAGSEKNVYPGSELHAESLAKLANDYASAEFRLHEIAKDWCVCHANTATRASEECRKTTLCLAAAIAAYTDHAQALIQRLGIPLANDIAAGSLALLFPLSAKREESRMMSDRFAAMVAIDESSRIANVLANSVLQEMAIREGAGDAPHADRAVYLSHVHHIMASQAPGTLVSLMRQHPKLRRAVAAVYEDRYWHAINSISVQAQGGKSTTMLVKDQTGNWHLKALDADPTELIKTAQLTAETMLKIAARASGAPIPAGPTP